jgi:hypothetical protein
VRRTAHRERGLAQAPGRQAAGPRQRRELRPRRRDPALRPTRPGRKPGRRRALRPRRPGWDRAGPAAPDHCRSSWATVAWGWGPATARRCHRSLLHQQEAQQAAVRARPEERPRPRRATTGRRPPTWRRGRYREHWEHQEHRSAEAARRAAARPTSGQRRRELAAGAEEAARRRSARSRRRSGPPEEAVGAVAECRTRRSRLRRRPIPRRDHQGSARSRALLASGAVDLDRTRRGAFRIASR